jgi:hypothetical protein
MSAVISRTAATITKQAACPSCDTGFTHPATRPQRYCSPKCRDIASNARRAPTGNRPGRPRTGAKTLGAISMLIPEEAAPQFLDDAAPRNGMMPPPDSEMIAPPITE